MSFAVFTATFYLRKYFWTCLEGIALLQVVNNISECYVKFKQTNQSCSFSKISQSVNMKLISTVLFIKARKL